MLSDTRPSKVGNWTEPALRVLRERYLTRKGEEVELNIRRSALDGRKLRDNGEGRRDGWG